MRASERDRVLFLGRYNKFFCRDVLFCKSIRDSKFSAYLKSSLNNDSINDFSRLYLRREEKHFYCKFWSILNGRNYFACQTFYYTV